MTEAVFEAFVTNLGKYVEGELCGEWLKLPAQKADVQALLQRIGVDGAVYEETFITDYRSQIYGLCKYMGEYESLDELNYLAFLISDMNKWDSEKFAAALEMGEYTSSVKDLINLTQNLDCYEIMPGVEDEEDLGRYYVEELGSLEIPENIEQYFDFEAYGRDISMESTCAFTDNGYIEDTGDSFTEYYDGIEDIPDEYRIFAYPDTEKMNVHDRMAMYQQMVSASAAADRPAPKREEIS